MQAHAIRWAAYAIALICALPLLATAIAAVTGPTETWQGLMQTVLPRYAWATFQLTLLVAVGTCAIGTGAAWLVTNCSFPGRRWFEIGLALPLAFPGYVLAYAYTQLLDHPGPIQTALRDLTGWGPRDYWFPEIRSLPGAALMLVLVLYPYVYLLARASFLQQAPSGFLAARVLGKRPFQAFLTVTLPMARPAIAGGVILAVMETIADYGTVAYFGVQTFATGIFVSWFSMGERAAAAQLALCLLLVALSLAAAERLQRGVSRRHAARGTGSSPPRHVLRGWHRVAAITLCAIPVTFGFLLPTLVLGEMALRAEQSILSERYLWFVRNSVLVASIAALVTVLGAVTLGSADRLAPSRRTKAAVLVAGLGYAIPGGVIAIGLLVPLAAFDNALDGWMRAQFGVSTGLMFTGSIAVLVLAYVARFMAAALSAVDSGYSAINPHVDAAARTLGTSPVGTFRRVHAPLMVPSLFTGLLIVFVDVMKELPATLILRPFNFDTLAVQAHRLASDERLVQAAVPSLVIMAFGLLPVIVLCRAMLGAGRASRANDAQPAAHS